MKPLLPRHQHGRRAGFALIELAIAVVLLSIMLMAITLTTQSASSSFKVATADEDLATRAHRALDFVAGELADSGLASLTPSPDNPFGVSSLTYRKCMGWAGGAAQWSALDGIALQLESGEVDDGLDNNGNELIDERVIVWTREAGAPTQVQTVKTRWVREFLEGEVENGADDNGNGLLDETGLSFFLTGEVLTIRITLERRDGQGRLQTKTVESSMRIRNQGGV
jgi:prepilin-type N-terminal cleavage/methylation domain-containing protein